MIRSLVENQAAAVTDIISGKGGGCIFLLHGAPGVGKTLTSEGTLPFIPATNSLISFLMITLFFSPPTAIAELLHKPLYSVSVGELGTSTDVLEERLREILEVASTWKGCVNQDFYSNTRE